jgi:AcrR family transcriptional regulator
MSNKPNSKPEVDRQSQRTRHALIDAFLSLLTEKHYDAISIKEIVDRANVGRSTFYSHYESKDDLLKDGFERILDILLLNVTINEVDQKLYLDTSPLFRHARGHYELYRTLNWGKGFELLTQDEHVALSEKLQLRLKPFSAEGTNPAVPLPILAYSMAGSLLLLLKWWLDNKMPCTEEQMNEYFQQLVMPGVKTALGLTKTTGDGK